MYSLRVSSGSDIRTRSKGEIEMEKKQGKKQAKPKTLMHDGDGQRGEDLLKWSNDLLKKAEAEAKAKKKKK